MNKLTVVIITYNEEENIARCLDSVKTIADETIVMDSFSTDRTREIAQQSGAQVHTRIFDTYGKQKNAAHALATHEYILSLDADEALSKELSASIALAKNNFTADAYTMNRVNYYCGQPVRTCGWYPDTKIRLFRKNKAQWDEALVHEQLRVPSGGSLAHLSGDLLHYTYPTKQSMIEQCDKFATIAAQQLRAKPLWYLRMKMLFSPPVKFIRNYVWNLGFTDGATGWTICYHQSREVFLKYFRAMKLKQA